MNDGRGRETSTGGSESADAGNSVAGAAAGTRAADSDDAGTDRVLILNPTAGSADQSERIRELAAEAGIDVRESEEAGHAIDLAREAAAEAKEAAGARGATGAEGEAGDPLIVAAGGDGTVNEVVRGVVEADALDSVTLGVVPAGTGNNFAGNVGITGVEHAFEVLESGEVRTVDVGFADGRPFVNSCIGGLTAEASADTSSEAKSRLGVLAYVLATLRTAVEFDGLPLHIETVGSAEADWSGDAAFVLIGNGRRFPAEGRTQADVEDGLLDVTVIEDRPTFDLVGEAAKERLLGAESQNIVRFKARELSVSVLDAEPGTFSLDGEMVSAGALSVTVRERALDLHVGEGYEPHPDW